MSGLFIAAFNAFDMLDEAKEVDLYQVVYDITKSRSKLIPSLVRILALIQSMILAPSARLIIQRHLDLQLSENKQLQGN